MDISRIEGNPNSTIQTLNFMGIQSGFTPPPLEAFEKNIIGFSEQR
ncbi:hypothetical protein [Enterococcus sp. AZ126]